MSEPVNGKQAIRYHAINGVACFGFVKAVRSLQNALDLFKNTGVLL